MIYMSGVAFKYATVLPGCSIDSVRVTPEYAAQYPYGGITKP